MISPTLKVAETTYQFTKEELYAHFAEAIGCNVNQITITNIQTPNTDFYDRGPTTYTFNGLKVVVKEIK